MDSPLSSCSILFRKTLSRLSRMQALLWVGIEIIIYQLLGGRTSACYDMLRHTVMSITNLVAYFPSGTRLLKTYVMSILFHGPRKNMRNSIGLISNVYVGSFPPLFVHFVRPLDSWKYPPLFMVPTLHNHFYFILFADTLQDNQL